MKLAAAERRRDSVKLHLLKEHLIAVGHVAVRAGMLDEMITLTAGQTIRQYPKTMREEAKKFSTPQKLKLIRDALGPAAVHRGRSMPVKGDGPAGGGGDAPGLVRG
jgi:hypothetical protein